MIVGFRLTVYFGIVNVKIAIKIVGWKNRRFSLIGNVAGVLTSSAFYKDNIKDKKTESISLLIYSIFILSLLSWLAYGIVKNDYPVMLTNFITLIPATIIFKYK